MDLDPTRARRDRIVVALTDTTHTVDTLIDEMSHFHGEEIPVTTLRRDLRRLIATGRVRTKGADLGGARCYTATEETPNA